MFKLIAVFFAGIIESLLFTLYLVSVDKRQLFLSTLYMFTYMSIYLFIIAFAIKDASTISLLLAYALASSIGNWIVIKTEKIRELSILKHRQTHFRHAKKRD